ncbi:hypothetical protein DSECCO2_598470 [anaerobic digester metagenome]
MVAFRARRLVWEEMAVMVAVTALISLAASPSSVTRPEASWALTTAFEVVFLARSEFWAISWMVADISSAAAATVFMLTDACSMAAETEFMFCVTSPVALLTALAIDAVRAEPAVIWVEMPESCVEEEARAWVAVVISPSISLVRPTMVFMAPDRCPMASFAAWLKVMV